MSDLQHAEIIPVAANDLDAGGLDYAESHNPVFKPQIPIQHGSATQEGAACLWAIGFHTDLFRDFDIGTEK
jgi:hypothetical protein